MQAERTGIVKRQEIIFSEQLAREVIIDIYFPPDTAGPVSLLLINDGQNLPEMHFEKILKDLYSEESLQSLLCVGIHCGKNRRNEYGTVGILDYKGRGNKAEAYQEFVISELLPFIRKTAKINSFTEKSICGFSLGGLSALDTALNFPHEFARIGVFSGSFWWRTVSQDDEEFDEDKHRIMHQKIRKGGYYPWLKFFFQTGSKDETADRNKNGIIDVIDDTINLIDELIRKGYDPETDIKYIELTDGRHDIPTWGRVFPEFLKWGWGSE